jgi:1-acyl-sn-glycerol-3-phosphate acyltransferase
MKTKPRQSRDRALPQVSPMLMKWFAGYSRRYVGRHFHSVRVLKSAMPPSDCAHPLVIYLNHAAWWDPLVCLLLAREFFPERASFAPIDAEMLARYGIFRRLGFFGIDPGTASGARAFLRITHAVLASSANALWLTPQGRFMDPRERPLRFKDGLGWLAAREPNAAFVPLAIEYPFWTEPRPEILVAFGDPIVPAETPPSAAGGTDVFSEALESAQDELAMRSCRREPGDWETVCRGRAGIGAIYDSWRRLTARLRGKKFSGEHPQGAAQ